MEADLTNEQSIIDACAGCDIIIHTASPFFFKTKDPQSLIRPAVSGALAAMKGARLHKAKKVVMTSSLVSIMYPKPGSKIEVFDESVWSDVETCKPYERSKTEAEMAAWNFLKELPEDEKF